MELVVDVRRLVRGDRHRELGEGKLTAVDVEAVSEMQIAVEAEERLWQGSNDVVDAEGERVLIHFVIGLVVKLLRRVRLRCKIMLSQ